MSSCSYFLKNIFSQQRFAAATKAVMLLCFLVVSLVGSAQPVISSLSTYSGIPGSSVTISGSGFNTTAANNIVRFGSNKGTVTAASATALTVTVPNGGSFGPVSVYNSGTGLAALSQRRFLPTYNGSGYLADFVYFDPAIRLSSGDTSYSQIKMADIDGDGKPDIVAVKRDYSGLVSIFRNISTSGTLSPSSFAPKVDLVTGSLPNDFTIADIDGDGRLDIITANEADFTISVIRNNSTPGTLNSASFDAKVDFELDHSSFNLYGVTAGDVNGDGKPEVLVANSHTGTFSVFRNTATSGSINSSSFAAKVTFASGYSCVKIAIADLDGDAKPDVLTLDQNENKLSIFRNTITGGTINSGAFAAGVDFFTGSYPVDVQVCDIDGDGKQDVLLSNMGTSSSNVGILRNMATPGSITTSSFATPVMLAGIEPASISIADIDGDTKPDVLFSNYAGNTVSVYLNRASSGSITSSSFTARTDVGGGETFSGDVATCDLDNDGVPDLVMLDGATNNITIRHNHRFIADPSPMTITAVSPLAQKHGLSITITGTQFGSTIATNVVNFGSVKGTITAASATSITVTVPLGASYQSLSVTNTATGKSASYKLPSLPSFDNSPYIPNTISFDPYNHIYGAYPSWPWNTLQDIDGDSKPDLVTMEGFDTDGLSIYRNVGDSGTLNESSFATAVAYPVGDGLYSIQVADIDGDGKKDVIVSADSLYIYRNTATPGTIDETSLADRVAISEYVGKFTIGDINGDGKPEIVGENGYVLTNSSSAGTVSFAVSAYIGPMGNPILADIDGDGKPDLLYAEDDSDYFGYSGYLSVRRNLGYPVATPYSFAPKVSFASPDFAPNNIYTADMDCDGKLDVLFCSYSSNQFYMYRNSSTPGTINSGSLSSVITFTDVPTEDITIADFDGDNKPDIATAYGTYGIVVYRNISTPGSLSSSSFARQNELYQYGVDMFAYPYRLTAGDIDGDGKADLIAGSDYSGMIVLRNNPLVDIGSPITGPSTICMGSGAVYANAVPGGYWTSGDIYVLSAMEDEPSGFYGMSEGTATITYTTPSGSALFTVTVTPAASAITGSSMVCLGATATFTNATSGGTWSISNPSVASISSAGVVSGIAPGMATITYTTGAACYATKTIQIQPYIEPITADFASLCVGDWGTVSSFTLGTWSSSAPSVATVSTAAYAGTVTAISAGTTTISLTVSNSCGTVYATYPVTVNVTPAAITGTATVCVGAVTTLATTTTGGTWNSALASKATVDASGVVTGVSSGNVFISYRLSNGCVARRVVTINALPAAITGTTTVAIGATTALSSTTTGGTWSSSDLTIATVGSTGIVTGVSGGTALISYTSAAGCVRTASITVSGASISGSTSICTSSPSTLTASIGGGTWSSSTTAVATVGSSTGIVTGVGGGTSTISYTYSGGIATVVVTVSATLPTTGTITGATSVNTGSSTTLSSSVSGGVWSASNSNATVGSATGIVTGATTDTVTISYTVTNACGSSVATTVMTVSLPPIVGPLTISGTGTTTLSSSMPGGTWSTSCSHIATVSSGGVVTGVSNGLATITYTTGSGYTTAVVTVTSTTSAIGWPSAFNWECQHTGWIVSYPVAGGVWSTSDSGIGVYSDYGAIVGVTPGTVTISYTYGPGCTSTKAITIEPAPTQGVISGAHSLVTGETMTLSTSGSGGTWSSTNAHISIGSTGVATAVSVGTAIISYTSTTAHCGTLAATVAIPVSAGGCAYWSNVGNSGFTPGTSLVSRLAIDNSGIPYVSYPNNPIGGKLMVAKYNGSTWETIGSDLSPGRVNSYASPIAIDGSNNVYVAYSDIQDSFKATVKKFDGTSWEYVGSPDFSDGMVQGLCLALNPSGVPYVAYIDTPNSKKVTVMKFNGADWSPVGLAGFSSANITDMTMAVSGSGIPYVAFRDPANGNKGTVMKFNGTGWEVVGTAGLSAGEVYNNSLAIDSVGTPYLLYRDMDNSGKPTVMKFNGSSWDLAGGAPVSASSAGAGMIAINSDGIPYVGYMDGGADLKATVKKLNGTSWQVVGSAGFTGGWAQSMGIAISGSGVPYVVFSDYGNNTKTSVMKLVGTEVTITGAFTVCAGSNVTLSSSSSGGTWSSGSAGVATVGSLTGIVHAVGAGTATISYTMASGCTTTAVVTVNGAASAGTITGTATACVGGATTLSNAVTGGTWSSSNIAIAGVGSTGIVSGAAVGTAIISYTAANSCGSAVATRVVTVNATASAGTISGPSAVLIGSAITLGNTVGGGTWSAGNGNATVNSAGIVTGVAAGTLMISYTVSNSCGSAVATQLVTVNEEPLTISGALTVCIGATTALGASAGGGTWSSSDNSIASVSASGVVSGVSAGVAVITYTASAGTATVSVTVNAASSITGVTTLCPGTTGTVSLSSTGGTWTGGSTVVATAGTGGVITGIGAGVTTLTYSTGAGCEGTITVTVNPAPSSITGTLRACPGTSTTLSSTTAGGSWSTSDAAIATIGLSTGIVTGVSANTVTVTYTTGAGCYRTATVTINPAPAAIAGTLLICAGSSTTLTDATPGLSWTSGNTAVATVNPSGVVAGVSNGLATITYTAASTNCITTAEVSVNGVPTSIVGPATGCAGWSITLINSVPGGVWSSSNVATATVDPSTGVVTGVASGIVTITYTTGAGCYKTKQITINNSPAVTGYSTACVGLTTTLSGGASGTWSSSTPAIATIVTSGGYVTGVSAGTSTMTFTSTGTGCRATYVVSVIPVPSAITGPAQACTGAVLALTNSTPGGVWTSANTANATVGSATGITTIVGTGGSVTISYSFGSNCRATKAISLKPLPAVINGSPTVCTPVTTTLTTVTSGGTWTSSDASVATVGTAISASYGLVTGVSVGTAEITYTITSTGCARSTVVTVNAGLNPGTITSSGGFTLHTVSPLTSVTLSSTGASGGTWTSSNPAVATINSSTGVVTAVAAGTTTITYAVTASCTNITTKVITVTAGRPAGSNLAISNVQLYPNPTTGSFTLVSEEAGTLHVFSMDGKEITSFDIKAGINPLTLPAGLASGIYMCRYTGENGGTTMVRLVYERQ